MEAMVKKYQQRFRKFKDEMDRWDELQVRLISQFQNASSIIGRLQLLQDPKNFGSLSGMDGIVEALLGKQMESLQLSFSSIKKTMEELGNVVNSMEKIYRDGKQLVKGGSNQPSIKQLQQRVGLKPSLEDCLNGLMVLCNMHRSDLKESIVSALPELFWKARNHGAQDLSSLHQLLVDQPNIKKEEECPEWKNAVMEEMKAFGKNNTWRFVLYPRDTSLWDANGCYILKYKVDGTLDRHKARLVAKEFTQTYDVDYLETFSLVKLNTVSPSSYCCKQRLASISTGC
ncbi:uncharacterized protein At5g43822 isoform X2 [Cucumis melo]|uniref:Uncharacterized protein At5g43822 isoform X2 n=1 Tax=Cucumis melo TaxID=3656 RepID=A0ABM3L737_CUCME|nr:uncharacterized protein At5g43822 isoform X2 [Cucumis melo]